MYHIKPVSVIGFYETGNSSSYIGIHIFLFFCEHTDRLLYCCIKSEPIYFDLRHVQIFTPL